MMLPSIFIVGYGPGLGYGIASKFASEGYTVGLISRTPPLEPLNLPSPPGHVAFVRGDASNPPTLRRALDELESKLGRPSVVVYNVAGLGKGAKGPLDLLWQEVEQHARLGPGAGLLVGQWAAEHLVEVDGRKSLLYTGGGVAHEVAPSYTGLGIEKSAMLNLANNLSAVLKPNGIHVATISIFSTIQDSDPTYNKTEIAKVYWQAHQDGVKGLAEILY